MGERQERRDLAHAKARRLLLVDDEETLREVLAEVLASAAYEVEAYGEGAGALEAIRAREFDYYVFDLVLPDLNGEELCRAVAARGQAVARHVVLMTGYATEGDEGECAGVRRLHKPFHYAELLRTLNSLEA